MDSLTAVILSDLLRSASTRRRLLASVPPEDVDQRPLRLDQLAHALKAPDWAGTVDLANATQRATRRLRQAVEAGISAVAFDGAGYPPLLAAIPDPPPVLWCRGDVGRLSDPAVAVVGSRVGSPYACQVATSLATGLSARGVGVVSGLARGVDGAAHRGALDGGGPTIGVVGSGLDVVYPPEHRELMTAVASAGAVVSELPLGTPPLPPHFPRRNRIISGLVLAVVVVEASARSGSLITARLAAEQGRDVMAVPGNVLSGRSRGAHGLIKDGAKVVETVDDILEEIAPALLCREPAVGPGGETDVLLRLMDPGETYDPDELATRSRLDRKALSAELLQLELAGRVARSALGRYRRT